LTNAENYYPPATPVSLASAVNRTGIIVDGKTISNGGLDAGGSALSANQLGGSVSWNAQTYDLGAAGVNDVVSGSGQSISLPGGNDTTLSFLAVGVNGNQ